MPEFRVSMETIERWKGRARLAIATNEFVEVHPRALMALMDDLSVARVELAPKKPEPFVCGFCRRPGCTGKHF